MRTGSVCSVLFFCQTTSDTVFTTSSLFQSAKNVLLSSKTLTAKKNDRFTKLNQLTTLTSRLQYCSVGYAERLSGWVVSTEKHSSVVDWLPHLTNLNQSRPKKRQSNAWLSQRKAFRFFRKLFPDWRLLRPRWSVRHNSLPRKDGAGNCWFPRFCRRLFPWKKSESYANLPRPSRHSTLRYRLNWVDGQATNVSRTGQLWVPFEHDA